MEENVIEIAPFRSVSGKTCMFEFHFSVVANTIRFAWIRIRTRNYKKEENSCVAGF